MQCAQSSGYLPLRTSDPYFTLQLNLILAITLTVTVTGSFLLLPTGRPKAHHKTISVCSPVSISGLDVFSLLSMKSIGRLQPLQLCRQPVPRSRCGDRESPVADSSTGPRQDEALTQALYIVKWRGPRTRPRDDKVRMQCRSSGYID